MSAVNLIGSYNYALVALSVFIAMCASYTALDLASRVTAAGGWARVLWVLGGAGAMGAGIWSMHYIGMLAFILPIPVAYHWPTVLLSLLAAILASAIALYVVSRQKMSAVQAVAGSVLMGAGIASMHYIGMAAMRLRAMCQFNSFLVVLSVVFAVFISLAALWITFHFRDETTGIGREKLVGAVVMGAAIPVMHYTGMAAASFTPSSMPVDLSHAVSISALGTAAIVAVTFLVLGLALLTSSLDRRFAARALELQEEKLQRSEAYLAEAQRLSHTGSFGWRISTGEIIWSEETFRIFQYAPGIVPTIELVIQRVHPEDAALVKQTIERASQDGKDFEHEYRLLMADGAVKHVHVVARALSDESGSVEFVGAVTDISERKRTEEALRASENNLRRIIDSVPGLQCALSSAGKVEHANRPLLEYFGKTIEELDRWSTNDVVHPDDLPRLTDIFTSSMANGTPINEELRFRRADGVYRWFQLSIFPVRDADGKITGWYGLITDIEVRKQAEALREGESRILEMMARDAPLEEILENLVRVVEAQFAGLLCSVLLLDEDGQHVRHGAALSLPKSYTEAIDGLCIGPKAGSCGTAMYRREPVVVTDIRQDSLWESYREVAEPYGFRACWSVPILTHSGKVLGTFAMYYREPRSPSPAESRALEMATHLAGIAIERKLAREERERLRQAQADLAHANRVTTMGELAASLAHEVSQPIAAAVINASACMRLVGRDQPDLQEACAAARRAVESGELASMIIGRIRSQFNKSTLQREAVDVNEIIREMIALLRGEAMRYDISVRAELTSDFPEIIGDRVQLQQVTMNLIVNSIDAMKDVEGLREVSIKSQWAENGQILVSISDTGIGLPPQQKEQIFNAFFTTKPHGTGMGLRISRSIIESHGGHLWAADNSPRGATFQFTLPATVAAYI